MPNYRHMPTTSLLGARHPISTLGDINVCVCGGVQCSYQPGVPQLLTILLLGISAMPPEAPASIPTTVHVYRYV